MKPTLDSVTVRAAAQLCAVRGCLRVCACGVGGELSYDVATRVRLERCAAAAMLVVFNNTREIALALVAASSRANGVRGEHAAPLSESFWSCQPRPMLDAGSRSVVVTLGGRVAVPYGFE